MYTKPLSVVVALLLVTAAVPAATSAATPMDVAIEQDDATGDGVVTVTANGTAVANATVNVTGERAYEGNGTYQTDANGTVTLVQPDETQNVTAVATADNETAEATARLVGTDDLSLAVSQTDASVTVDVERNGTGVANATVNVTASSGNYSDTGEYAADENGTVELAAPEENATITVTATADGDTVSETLTLTVEAESENFGDRVSSFVESLRKAGFDGPPGTFIADFVTANNPGNAADAPGQSGDAPGQSGDAPGQSNDSEPGQAADNGAAAGPSDERGPPEHANGQQADDDETAAEADDGSDDEDENSEEEDDDGERGPPERANANR